MKVIQEFAGHKQSMAARYAHMDQSSLRSAVALLNRRGTDHPLLSVMPDSASA